MVALISALSLIGLYLTMNIYELKDMKENKEKAMD